MNTFTRRGSWVRVIQLYKEKHKIEVQNGCIFFIKIYKQVIFQHECIHSLSSVVVPATLHNISVNAHFTRFLNVFKIVLIIVNINKDEKKSLISIQFSLKNNL
jgi:hypothetical protein